MVKPLSPDIEKESIIRIRNRQRMLFVLEILEILEINCTGSFNQSLEFEF